MNNNYDSITCTVATLLGDPEQPRLVIPDYQRKYSWDKQQVEDLLADLVDYYETRQKRGRVQYFLGPIILMRSAGITSPGATTDIVDGQQRLATITILLSSLRDCALLYAHNNPRASRLAEHIQSRFLRQPTAARGMRFPLHLDGDDTNWFQKHIQQLPSTDAQTPSTQSKRLLRAAKANLDGSITSLVDHYEDPLDFIESFLECLSEECVFSAIHVGNQADAIAAFESTNCRGKDLAPGDVVRLRLMQQCSQRDRTTIKSYWNTLEQNLDGSGNSDQFLRDYFTSWTGSRPSRSLAGSYEHLLEAQEIGPAELARRLSHESAVYANIRAGSQSTFTDAASNSLVDGIVRELGFTQAIPTILWLWRTLRSRPESSKCIHMLESLVVRHRFLGQLPHEELDEHLVSIPQHCKDPSYDGVHRKMLNHLASIDPTNSQVLAGAVNANPLSNRQGRYILRRIENQLVDGDWKAEATLEHIFPLAPDSKHWRSRDSMRPLARHLGNMCLLNSRMNKSIQNREFAKKRKAAYEQSTFKLTASLAEYPMWSAKAIRDRSKIIAEKGLSVWPRLHN